MTLPSVSGFFFFFLTFFSIFFVMSSSTSIPSNNGTTVYQLLTEFGLPSGLLPNSVKNFSLDETGNFVVELENQCYIEFDYLVYYDKKITGVLKYGSITSLKGIQVRRFLIWLNVDEIRVDLPPANYIYFQVGWVNRKLDVKQFQDVHSCQSNQISCLGFWSDHLKLPAPVQEVSMLLTE